MSRRQEYEIGDWVETVVAPGHIKSVEVVNVFEHDGIRQYNVVTRAEPKPAILSVRDGGQILGRGQRPHPHEAG